MVILNSSKSETHHDARRERGPDIDVRNARVDVHPDRLSFVHEDLLEEHPRDLARLDIGVRHEVPLWTICLSPTLPEALLLHCSGLRQDVSRARYLRLNAPT